MSNNSNNNIELPQEWPGIHHIGQEEIDAVTNVLKNQSPFRFYGPKPTFEARQFEEEFAKYVGMKYCITVSNGTTALQVALSALNIGPGDEVIMPCYFWVSTAGAVVRVGAIPVLVDVDDSMSLDPVDLAKKITERTKAVIVVHMGGVIGQMDKILEICKSSDIPVLEDCAQAAGTSQFGKMAGSFGDVSIFSFQINKNMTCGEGGAVLTNDKLLYERVFGIHDTGYIKDEEGNFVLDRPELQLWGIGCRISDLAAAMARAQLKKLPLIINNMRSFKHEITEMLSEYKGLRIRENKDPEGESGGFLKMTFETREESYEFKEHLINNGIKVAHSGFYPIHMEEWGLHIYYNLPALVHKRPSMGIRSVWELTENGFAKDYTYDKGTLPFLDSLVERTVLFCIASNLTDEHKKLIRAAFRKTCDQLLERS
jgi:8-amino-3,8-dideoxy-alpha-D-manno-octulosonate transaminase